MARLSEAHKRTIRDIADGRLPGDSRDEALRIDLKNMGLALRTEAYPWRWYLTEAGRRALSPASTDAGGEHE